MTSGTTIYHRRDQTAMLKQWLLNKYMRNFLFDVRPKEKFDARETNGRIS